MGRIFLIGFMCSGKSTVGRVLAPMLGLPFVDLDRMVEERVGPLLPFVQHKGEIAFRQKENEVLGQLLASPDAVIATGGGTPCDGDNLARMKQAGRVVWLDVPLDMLMPRIIRTGGDRPLLFGLKDNALQERVKELLEARTPIYAQADLIVQAGAPPLEVARLLERALAHVR